MPATHKQSMFVTVAGDVVFATDPEAATGDFSTYQAELAEFLADTELNGPFRCRFYEGACPPSEVDPIVQTTNRQFISGLSSCHLGDSERKNIAGVS